MKQPTLIGISILVYSLFACDSFSQQITPRPTIFTRMEAKRSIPRPRELKSFRLPVLEFQGVRVEATSQTRMVFSDTSGTLGRNNNKRLFYWQSGLEDLIDTELLGIPGSVIMPDHGEYMVYLFNELDWGSDTNNDGEINQILLRFYHFGSALHLTLGIPARSGEEIITGISGSVLDTQRRYEYRLLDDTLIFSSSPFTRNTSDNRQANWEVIELNAVVNQIYEIVGTPTLAITPTHSPSPTPTATPTPSISLTPSPTVDPNASPTPQPTPTPSPTIPLELRQDADINGDGIINTLDLLLFREFWFLPANPSPTPTISF